jgi:hypothetical protein
VGVCATLSSIRTSGLTGPTVSQRAIRNFLKVRTSYDVLPLSFRLIVFDTSLSVKESLNILIQNGMAPSLPLDRTSD